MVDRVEKKVKNLTLNAALSTQHCSLASGEGMVEKILSPTYITLRRMQSAVFVFIQKYVQLC